MLIRSGIVVGCITNKPEAYAAPLLRAAGIGEMLGFIYGGDRFENRKPDPEPLRRAAEAFDVLPQHAVMVGDSLNDRLAAESAGFAFVFARYGYSPPDDVDLTRGVASIGRFADLGGLLCGQ